MQKLALLLTITTATLVGMPASAVAMHHRHVHSFFVLQTRPFFATQPFFAQRSVFVQRWRGDDGTGTQRRQNA